MLDELPGRARVGGDRRAAPRFRRGGGRRWSSAPGDATLDVDRRHAAAPTWPPSRCPSGSRSSTSCRATPWARWRRPGCGTSSIPPRDTPPRVTGAEKAVTRTWNKSRHGWQGTRYSSDAGTDGGHQLACGVGRVGRAVGGARRRCGAAAHRADGTCATGGLGVRAGLCGTAGRPSSRRESRWPRAGAGRGAGGGHSHPTHVIGRGPLQLHVARSCRRARAGSSRSTAARDRTSREADREDETRGAGTVLDRGGRHAQRRRQASHHLPRTPATRKLTSTTSHCRDQATPELGAEPTFVRAATPPVACRNSAGGGAVFVEAGGSDRELASSGPVRAPRSGPASASRSARLDQRPRPGGPT